MSRYCPKKIQLVFYVPVCDEEEFWCEEEEGSIVVANERWYLYEGDQFWNKFISLGGSRSRMEDRGWQVTEDKWDVDIASLLERMAKDKARA